MQINQIAYNFTNDVRATGASNTTIFVKKLCTQITTFVNHAIRNNMYAKCPKRNSKHTSKNL